MKKYFYLFAMLLLTATVFTSCSDEDDKGDSKDLIGKWQSVSESGWEKENGEIYDEWSYDYEHCVYEFTADGDFLIYYYSGGNWVLDQEGEYKYKNGKIIGYFDGDAESAEVKTLTSNTLVIAKRETEKYEGDTYEYYDELTFKKADNIDL